MTYLYYLLTIYGYGFYKGLTNALLDDQKTYKEKLNIILNHTLLSIPGIIFYLAEDINTVGDVLSKHFD